VRSKPGTEREFKKSPDIRGGMLLGGKELHPGGKICVTRTRFFERGERSPGERSFGKIVGPGEESNEGWAEPADGENEMNSRRTT